MKYVPIGMPLKDQQFIEQGQFTTTQIATLFNMPASKINGQTGDSLTYGNREQDAIDFVTFTLPAVDEPLAQGSGATTTCSRRGRSTPTCCRRALLRGDSAAARRVLPGDERPAGPVVRTTSRDGGPSGPPGGDDFPEPPAPAAPETNDSTEGGAIRKLVEAGAREQRRTSSTPRVPRADEDGKLKFRGHAAVFDEWTEIPSMFGGSFMERIAARRVPQGALRRRGRPVPHQPRRPPARADRLRDDALKEDTKGLLVDAELAPTTLAQDLERPARARRHLADELRLPGRQAHRGGRRGERRRQADDHRVLRPLRRVAGHVPRLRGHGRRDARRGVRAATTPCQVDEAARRWRQDRVARSSPRRQDRPRSTRVRRPTVVRPWMAERSTGCAEPELRPPSAPITRGVVQRSPPGGRRPAAPAARAWPTCSPHMGASGPTHPKQGGPHEGQDPRAQGAARVVHREDARHRRGGREPRDEPGRPDRRAAAGVRPPQDRGRGPRTRAKNMEELVARGFESARSARSARRP
jgi:hypothetical protein